MFIKSYMNILIANNFIFFGYDLKFLSIVIVSILSIMI